MSLRLRASRFLAVAVVLSIVPAAFAEPVIKVRQLLLLAGFDVEQRGAVSIAIEMVVRNT
jgi:hypothetical protein